MSLVVVYRRVVQRHPELSLEGVARAWSNAIRFQQRDGTDPPRFVAIGFEDRGRLLQMVAVQDDGSSRWLVFHAMRASKHVLRELGLNIDG